MDVAAAAGNVPVAPGGRLLNARRMGRARPCAVRTVTERHVGMMAAGALVGPATRPRRVRGGAASAVVQPVTARTVAMMGAGVCVGCVPTAKSARRGSVRVRASRPVRVSNAVMMAAGALVGPAMESRRHANRGPAHAYRLAQGWHVGMTAAGGLAGPARRGRSVPEMSASRLLLKTSTRRSSAIGTWLRGRRPPSASSSASAM